MMLFFFSTYYREWSKNMALIHALLIFTLFGAFSLPGNSFKRTFPDSKLTLKYDRHPMLYFTADSLPEYRSKKQTTHIEIFEYIQELRTAMNTSREYIMPPKDSTLFVSKWNEHFGNNLPPLALYCLLEPDDKSAYRDVIAYMDRMATYPTWRVKGQDVDEVPVSHNLAGFATAYDFLHHTLNARRRKLYLAKIKNVTMELYVSSKTKWWGKTYLQNHVTTNHMATLIGAIISTLHDSQFWGILKQVVLALEKTVSLLLLITDGSLNEGVGYTSYTSKSLMEYFFLVKRHFDLDHSHHPWLKQHFWYYYHTTLPGFREIVGIADVQKEWFYGPESQLVFLNAFVLKNGYGNWLAKRIRQKRGEKRSYMTRHTEFIWYDATLTAAAPFGDRRNHLHVFDDWGVVVYGGGGTYRGSDSTFLSFKSGKINGRGINDLVHTNRSWLEGWKSFNAGHEHPDQNSFTFFPSGRPLITDGLYSMKFSSLNNVLLFAPSNESKCSKPWAGQRGDCAKWLRWKLHGDANGEVVTATDKNGVIHTSGEAVEAYAPSLGVKSVYRNLILLNPALLVVFDYVESTDKSLLTHVSAMFNNIRERFTMLRSRSGAKVNLAGQQYQVMWKTIDDVIPSAKLTLMKYKSQDNIRTSSNINITIPFHRRRAYLAVILYAKNQNVTDFEFSTVSNKGVSIDIGYAGKCNRIKFVTDYKNLTARRHLLGTYGFYQLSSYENCKDIKYNLPVALQSRVKEDLSIVKEIPIVILVLSIALILRMLKYRKLWLRYLIIFIQSVLFLSLAIYTYNEYLINTPKQISLPSRIEQPSTVYIFGLPYGGLDLVSTLFLSHPDIIKINNSHPEKMCKHGHFKMGSLSISLISNLDTMEDIVNYLKNDHGRRKEKVIVIMRDPQLWIANMLRNNKTPHSPTVESLTDMWKRFADLSKQTFTEDEFFRFLVLKLEEITAYPESWGTIIYDFISLPFPPAMAHQFKRATYSHYFHRYFQDAQDFVRLATCTGVNVTNSNSLSAEQRSVIMRKCRPGMASFGYQDH